MGEYSIFCCHCRIHHWGQTHRSERDRKTMGKTISLRMLWVYPEEPLKLRDTVLSSASQQRHDDVLKKEHEGGDELWVSTGQMIGGKCTVAKGTWLGWASPPLLPAMCPGCHIGSARVSPRRQGKEALSQDEHRLSGIEGKVELSLDFFLNFFISALRPKGTNSGPMFHL